MTSPINVWYLDDGTIGGDLNTVLTDFEMIIEEAKTIGLEVNISKCELSLGETCPYQEIDRNDVKILQKHELFLLGSALNLESTQQLVTKKIQDMERILTKLSILPSHYALHALRNCYSAPKIIYLLRTTPCLQDNVLNCLDSLIEKATSEFGNLNFTKSALDQASLPCRFGGLGIRKASDLAVPAFLSSMVAAEGLIKNLNPLAHRSSQFEEGLQSWRHTTLMEWPLEPAKQRSWDEALMQIKVKNLLNDATDVYNQKRLQSLQNKNAGDWLNAVPSRNLGTFLNDDEIRPVLCVRLGLPYVHERLCKCGMITDSLGKHCF